MPHKQVVVLIHGIRDNALWHANIRAALEKAGFAVELTNYSRFDLVRFLFPGKFFRNAAVEKIWLQIEQIYLLHPKSRISFIAHSFGTYVLAEILRTKINFRANRIIFCGSVVSYDYPFEQALGKFDGPVLNEVGTKDIWPAMAQSITTGYGAAGTYGFRRPNVRDRWHTNAGHGYFLNEQFSEKFWVPFLRSGEVIDGDNNPMQPALWVRLLSVFRIKYALGTIVIVGFISVGHLLSKDHSLDNWLSAVQVAQSSKIIDASKPMSDDLSSARSNFETWWRNAGLESRRVSEPDAIYKAVSNNAKLYRMYESKDELKPNANFWTTQCLEYFEQIQSAHYVAECLLDRAALFLDLSDIAHTDPTKFKQVAEEGDTVMARAASIVDDKQRPEALRMASRFYYNLARPADGLLSNSWDDNYLSLSVKKAHEADELDPSNLRNLTQLSRSMQRFGANPLYADDMAWTAQLRKTQVLLSNAFSDRKKSLTSPEAFIPPANILAVLTMDVVRREWKQSHISNELLKGKLEEIENTAIPALVEAWALVRHMPQVDGYQFDLNYDLGRLRSLATQILDASNDPRAETMFQEALVDFRVSAQKATAIQLRAAFNSIDSEPNISGLSDDRRNRLKELFSLK